MAFIPTVICQAHAALLEASSMPAQAPASKKPKTDVSAANGSSTIFVKNLPWSADEDTIAEFFCDCGTVANVRIGEIAQSAISSSLWAVELPT